MTDLASEVDGYGVIDALVVAVVLEFEDVRC